MFSASKKQLLKINYVNCSFLIGRGDIIFVVLDIRRIDDAYEFCPYC